MNNIILMLIVCVFSISCTQSNPNSEAIVSTEENIDLSKYKKAYFASGCFWCVEAIFESVKGVKEVYSGYSGGKEKNPTYEQVGGGQTTHAEAVEVIYDPEVINFSTLLEVYYGSHNPTTVNGQSPDFGRQYRSMILYTSEEEKKLAIEFKKKLDDSGIYGAPVATEIEAFTKFWRAEEYHQDYEKRNPNNTYVQRISIPRLNRFKEKFPHLLKENH